MCGKLYNTNENATTAGYSFVNLMPTEQPYNQPSMFACIGFVENVANGVEKYYVIAEQCLRRGAGAQRFARSKTGRI